MSTAPALSPEQIAEVQRIAQSAVRTFAVELSMQSGLVIAKHQSAGRIVSDLPAIFAEAGAVAFNPPATENPAPKTSPVVPFAEYDRACDERDRLTAKLRAQERAYGYLRAAISSVLTHGQPSDRIAITLRNILDDAERVINV